MTGAVPGLSGCSRPIRVHRHIWRSRHDAELAIFRWVEGWCNPRRIQTVGWMMADTLRTELVLGALEIATRFRAAVAPVGPPLKAVAESEEVHGETR